MRSNVPETLILGVSETVGAIEWLSRDVYKRSFIPILCVWKTSLQHSSGAANGS